MESGYKRYKMDEVKVNTASVKKESKDIGAKVFSECKSVKKYGVNKLVNAKKLTI